MPLLCVGCVQFFGLEDPSHTDDDATPMGDGSGSGGGEETSTCPGVIAEGRCFERFFAASSWEEAADHCKQLGQRLAKLETPAIHAAVGKLLSLGDEAYVGGSDLLRNGEYVWLDGIPVSMDNGWLITQPDYEVDEYCMAMQNAGPIGYHDTRCTDIRDYICEQLL